MEKLCDYLVDVSKDDFYGSIDIELLNDLILNRLSDI